MAADNCSVKVAVRVRPLAKSEIAKGCKEILDVVQENEQIVISRSDKAFTYNYVFNTTSSQEEVYDRCVKDTMHNLFKGYNVTILAYGQTGSGKTHTMGTNYKMDGEMGVMPRAVSDIFSYVHDHLSLDFTISVSFVELYQEVLYDLFSKKPRDQCVLEIRMDAVKGVHIPNITEETVTSSDDVFDALGRGSLGRATGSTNMNSQSSRSHAIFTINICMQNKADAKENKMAKLHLVDLAGSERPKKTGAVGNTFKEAVNINKGLFVLGNVISCLGDEKQQNSFVPYRDSNLTRLLKDSLGGNSITLMIACVSPADYNLEETMSTLRYADRARKIKNKPIVIQDAEVAEIKELKKTIQQLRLQIVGQGGPVICPAEIELLKKQIDDLQKKIREQSVQLSAAVQAENIKNSGKIERVGEWIKQELDLDVNIVAAKETLAILLEDRATLQQQLNILKADPETEASEECKSIKEDLECRSAQIQDLQQKILDSDEDNRAKTRFDNIQTMAEAKFALKSLYDLSIEIKKKEVQTNAKLVEVQETLKEVEKSKMAYNNMVKILEKKCNTFESNLLRQLKGVEGDEDEEADQALLQRCEIQQKKIESQEKLIDELKEQLEEMKNQYATVNETFVKFHDNDEKENFMLDSSDEEEVDDNKNDPDWRKTPLSRRVIHEIKKIKTLKKNGKFNFFGTPVATSQKPKKTTSKVSGRNETFVKFHDNDEKENFIFDSSDEEEVDDNKNDPDWRKTPLARRVLDDVKKIKMLKKNDESNRGKVKGSSEGGCTCKTSCQRRCGCRKVLKHCREYCKCNSETCQNQDKDSTSNNSSNPSDENDSFKMPRLEDTTGT